VPILAASGQLWGAPEKCRSPPFVSEEADLGLCAGAEATGLGGVDRKPGGEAHHRVFERGGGVPFVFFLSQVQGEVKPRGGVGGRVGRLGFDFRIVEFEFVAAAQQSRFAVEIGTGVGGSAQEGGLLPAVGEHFEEAGGAAALGRHRQEGGRERFHRAGAGGGRSDAQRAAFPARAVVGF
jgi:hypothetical protein